LRRPRQRGLSCRNDVHGAPERRRGRQHERWWERSGIQASLTRERNPLWSLPLSVMTGDAGADDFLAPGAASRARWQGPAIQAVIVPARQRPSRSDRPCADEPSSATATPFAFSRPDQPGNVRLRAGGRACGRVMRSVGRANVDPQESRPDRSPRASASGRSGASGIPRHAPADAGGRRRCTGSYAPSVPPLHAEERRRRTGFSV